MKFTLSLPVSINSLYKSGRNGWYKDQKAVDWQTEALWEIKKQKKGQRLFHDINYNVSIYWWRKDNRKYDIDGGIKLLLDTLVKSEIIEDDSMITELHVYKAKYDKNQCEVEIL